MPDAPLKTKEEMAKEYDQLLLKQEASMRQQATDRVNKGIKARSTKAKKSKGKRAKNRRK